MKNKQNESNDYKCVLCETGEGSNHGSLCSCNKSEKNKDIEDFTDEDLKNELGIVLRELQNRNILYCLKCGATDFFNSDCDECLKVESISKL